MKLQRSAKNSMEHLYWNTLWLYQFHVMTTLFIPHNMALERNDHTYGRNNDVTAPLHRIKLRLHQRHVVSLIKREIICRWIGSS